MKNAMPDASGAKSRVTLVTGGARSGKSALAEGLVARTGRAMIYIATAQAGDAEMGARIAAHQARRGADWSLIEAPLDLCAALVASDGQGVRLVDCLTLWLSNISFAAGQEASADDVAAQVAGLCDTLARQRDPVVMVTNELGLGIVPQNALARRFRDDHGLMNQQVARAADEVWMAVSGLPLRLKPGRDAI